MEQAVLAVAQLIVCTGVLGYWYHLKKQPHPYQWPKTRKTGDTIRL